MFIFNYKYYLTLSITLVFLLFLFLQKSMNALHFASRHGHVTTARLLIEAGINTDSLDSVIIDAYPSLSLQTCWLINSQYREFNDTHLQWTWKGRLLSVLICELAWFSNEIYSAGNTIRIMLKRSMRFRWPSSISPQQQTTPLHIAVLNNHVETVRLLIDAECDLDVCDGVSSSLGTQKRELAKLQATIICGRSQIVSVPNITPLGPWFFITVILCHTFAQVFVLKLLVA